MRREFAYVQGWHQKLASMGWWHSFELPDGSTVEGVCPLDGLKNRLAQFPISHDLTGKRILDIGAWDGFFTFELEKRGAEVMAVDCWDNPRFRLMRGMLGSRADYRVYDVYDLSPSNVGRFDIVIFFGVLYHLKHPLLALERVCALSTDLVAVDSFVVKETRELATELARKPVMEFYETDDMGGMTDNWSGPNVSCLAAMCRAAGFARVQPLALLEHSACIVCYRKWEPGASSGRAPNLIHAIHNTNFGLNFDSQRDEYVSFLFDPAGTEPTLRNTKPEIGQYGSSPMYVTPIGNGYWQVNFKLPPGLSPGWHDATLRIGESSRSNAMRVAVDVPLQATSIEVTGVQDAATYTDDQVDLSQGRHITIWVTPLPENADRNNVHVTINGARVPTTFAQGTQVNAELPDDLPASTVELRVSIAEAESRPVALRITRSARE
jgi:tRNA (mo5U34)-methyltransferase